MAESRITDIVLFFAQTTEAYRKFEQSITELTHLIPVLSSQELGDKCKNLRKQRAKLEVLDQQMFDIIDLAGKQICRETMIDDHRIALAQANMASNKLAQKLRALKIILRRRLSILSHPPITATVLTFQRTSVEDSPAQSKLMIGTLERPNYVPTLERRNNKAVLERSKDINKLDIEKMTA